MKFNQYFVWMAHETMFENENSITTLLHELTLSQVYIIVLNEMTKQTKLWLINKVNSWNPKIIS